MSDDNTIELNRRRVLGGLVTVGGAAAAAGAGTFALFSDDETSDSNTIQAGTLDLESPETGGTFSIENLVPEDDFSGTISVIYAESSNVDQVNLTVSLTLSDSDQGDTTGSMDATEFAELLNVDTATLQIGEDGASHDITTDAGSTTGPDDNSYTSLSDVVSEDVPEDALSTVSPGDTVNLDIGGTFVSGAGNDAQGQGVNLEATFTANQPSN